MLDYFNYCLMLLFISSETPAKQPETPDLFKPHSANRSLTSRRTAPVTLFST